jgi:hypothetical protein
VTPVQHPPEAGGWIFGRRIDLAVFGGSAALALGLVALSGFLSDAGELPSWGFVVLILAIDVAHVYATLFRTYLDRQELSRRRALYAGLPVACYAVGLCVHLGSERAFWRALAYLAVFHFVRQQVGWVAIYRARSGKPSRLDRVLDDAVIYAATGFPLLYWHAHLPRAFHWFVEGDFVPAPWLVALIGPLGVLYAVIAAAYLARAVHVASTGGPVPYGKHLVVTTTALVWYAGIVWTNRDFDFTVTNVIVHGVPYMALLWAYSRERAREAPATITSRIVAGGISAFFAVLLALAFAEEMLWDRLVWHARPGLFGGAARDEPLLGPLARALVVPLLAVPQATHYALDAVLWRRRDTGTAQAKALGFRGRSALFAAPGR